MAASYTENIEQIRKQEYPFLAGLSHRPHATQNDLERADFTKDVAYLDHAGTTLYAKSLIEQFSEDLKTNLLGNPHSASPSSRLSTHRVEDVRARVLRSFKADPNDFDVVFVANATAGIKLVAEAFRDYGFDADSQHQSGFLYRYHKDAHTSLVGVRELATAGSRCFASNEAVDSWIDGRDPERAIHGRAPGLFAYTAQSNLDGRRLPLTWPGRLRKSEHPWLWNTYTLLDASSYVSTAQLDLSDVESAPDFTVLSFYKIFGFPDLGALVVRKEAGHMLRRRRYFGGGTVDMVISLSSAWHARKEDTLHDQLEDGTLPFHNIIALGCALDVHQRLYGSMDAVSQHTSQLAGVLHHELSSLRHANGGPVCEIYKDPNSTYGDAETQGPIVAFNVRNSQGGWVGKSKVEEQAIEYNVHLRTGGVCNPGGIATALNLEPWEMKRNFAEGMRCGDNLDVISGKPTGVIRVSLGAMSNLRDVATFVDFMKKHWVDSCQPLALTPPLGWPQSLSEQHSFVQSLRVFPIEGNSGWDVPSNSTWEIKQHGLAWEHEWCLVRPRGRSALDSRFYPRIAFLQPSLHLKEGVLKIRMEDVGLVNTAVPRELTVSLLDSPPTHVGETEQGPHRAADPYLSAEYEDFFTFVIGTPCTLARYPDPRRQGLNEPLQEQGLRSWRRRRPPERPCTLSVADEVERIGDAKINIKLASSLLPLAGPQTWQFLSIGHHSFQVLETPPSFKQARNASVSSRRFRHLISSADVTLAAQYPTIRVGDAVQLFSESASAKDEPTRLEDSLNEPVMHSEQLPGPGLIDFPMLERSPRRQPEFRRSISMNGPLWQELRT